MTTVTEVAEPNPFPGADGFAPATGRGRHRPSPPALLAEAGGSCSRS
ncbi:MAG: hypothetical protein R2749_21870 [Acidimicrobiales bacterium]